MSDSIDADLLDYYQRELTWLRHAGGAFAERYPKVARRLQLAPGECPDPHVERLLEGFSLLTARLQRRLDDDYAEFSDALLEQLYPLALRPLPSCAIVQFEPDPTQGNLAEGYRLPRDTALFVTTRGGDSVHFRSSAEATLWPLAIDEANLLGGEEAQALTGVGAARSALRLSLRCLGEYRWDELSIERLRIHLAASPMGCAILYDLLAAHTVQVMAGAPGTPPAALRGLPEIVGFAADEALLPEEDGGHPGLRLLAEYFAFPTSSTSSTCHCPARSPTDRRSTCTWSSIAHRRHACICRRKTSSSAARRRSTSFRGPRSRCAGRHPQRVPPGRRQSPREQRGNP